MDKYLWFVWLIPFHQFHWLIPTEAVRTLKNRSRIDPDWSENIERLEIDYNEKGRFPSHLATKFYSPRNRWDLAGHHEIPYYAILYTNITVESHPSPSTGKVTTSQVVNTLPGSACGGILVNNKQVLTTCGCLYAWWRFITYSKLTEKEKKSFNAEFQIFRYTMFSKIFPTDVPTFIPTIYMSHSQVYFAPDFSHVIENDLTKQTAEWLNCTSWEASGIDGHNLMFGLVLANFNPEIQDLDLSSFIPWPPVPIANVTRYNRFKPVDFDSVAVYPSTGIRARVVGMGFKAEGSFFDDLGSNIDVESAMVDAEAEVVHIDECMRLFIHLNNLKAYVKDYCVCLRGVVDGDGSNSVKNSLPGNPVLTGFGSLAGMVVDSDTKSKKEHYYVILNFIAGLQYKMENENYQYLIQRQKVVRAPLYREHGGWERIFLQYTVPPVEVEAATELEPAEKAAAPPQHVQTYSILFFIVIIVTKAPA